MQLKPEQTAYVIGVEQNMFYYALFLLH